MNELKKCPFCGGKPAIRHTRTNENNSMYIESVFSVKHELICQTCGYKFGCAISEYTIDESGQIKTVKDGYMKLVDRWNERVEERKES